MELGQLPGATQRAVTMGISRGRGVAGFGALEKLRAWQALPLAMSREWRPTERQHQSPKDTESSHANKMP
jgi:hypothetical protein